MFASEWGKCGCVGTETLRIAMMQKGSVSVGKSGSQSLIFVRLVSGSMPGLYVDSRVDLWEFLLPATSGMSV